MFAFRSADDLFPVFRRIGEEGWEEKTRRILKAQAEEWGTDMPQPVSEARLGVSEKRLGVSLPEGLRCFLQVFGVADIGEELQAPENMVPLFAWTDGIDLNEFMTSDELEVFPELVTFSEHLGIGNVFCFHRQDGSVYFFDSDTAPYIARLFDSVDEYLRACLINVQDIFFDSSIDDPEALVEERLVQLFGEKIVAKWLY